jgi:hypothetical protein
MNDRPFVLLPTKGAFASLQAMDASMQAEFREHAAIVAADPAGELVRSADDASAVGLYEYSYDSEVASGLRITMVVAELDLAERRGVVVGIGVTGPPLR